MLVRAKPCKLRQFTHLKIRCCFSLAEARKKRKTFLSHTSGSLGACVRGGIGNMAYEIAHFSCCHSPLPDLPPTHPSSFLEIFHFSCCMVQLSMATSCVGELYIVTSAFFSQNKVEKICVISWGRF